MLLVISGNCFGYVLSKLIILLYYFACLFPKINLNKLNNARGITALNYYRQPLHQKRLGAGVLYILPESTAYVTHKFYRVCPPIARRLHREWDKNIPRA